MELKQMIIYSDRSVAMKKFFLGIVMVGITIWGLYIGYEDREWRTIFISGLAFVLFFWAVLHYLRYIFVVKAILTLDEKGVTSPNGKKSVTWEETESFYFENRSIFDHLVAKKHDGQTVRFRLSNVVSKPKLGEFIMEFGGRFGL